MTNVLEGHRHIATKSDTCDAHVTSQLLCSDFNLVPETKDRSNDLEKGKECPYYSWHVYMPMLEAVCTESSFDRRNRTFIYIYII